MAIDTLGSFFQLPGNQIDTNLEYLVTSWTLYHRLITIIENAPRIWQNFREFVPGSQMPVWKG